MLLVCKAWSTTTFKAELPEQLDGLDRLRGLSRYRRCWSPRAEEDLTDLREQLTSELDRAFDDPLWPRYGLPALRNLAVPLATGWSPRVDVFEKDNRLITKVDLPGVKKEDVTVEVADGRLALSGERRRESEGTKDGVYRSEREHGSFYRTVPLPEGVKLEDVKATFADGVLEVSVPLPARPQAAVRKVDIQEPPRPGSPRHRGRSPSPPRGTRYRRLTDSPRHRSGGVGSVASSRTNSRAREFHDTWKPTVGIGPTAEACSARHTNCLLDMVIH